MNGVNMVLVLFPAVRVKKQNVANVQIQPVKEKAKDLTRAKYEAVWQVIFCYNLL